MGAGGVRVKENTRRGLPAWMSSLRQIYFFKHERGGDVE